MHVRALDPYDRVAFIKLEQYRCIAVVGGHVSEVI